MSEIFHIPRVFTRQSTDRESSDHGRMRIGLSMPARIRKSQRLFTHTKSENAIENATSSRREPAQSFFFARADARAPIDVCARSGRDDRSRKIPAHRSLDDRINRHRRDRSRRIANSTSSWKRISSVRSALWHHVSSVRERAASAASACLRVDRMKK